MCVLFTSYYGIVDFVCAHTRAVGLKVLGQVFALADELAVEDRFESLISRLHLYQRGFCKHDGKNTMAKPPFACKLTRITTF